MMKTSMRTRLIAGFTAVALGFAGFLGAAPAQADGDVCAVGTTTGCVGELPGGLGAWEVKVPANFNGTVLVYFHGYKISKNAPLPDLIAKATGYDKDPTYASVDRGELGKFWFGSGVPELVPGNAPAGMAAMLAKGYAIAGLGYGANQGWAVQEGVAAGSALITKVRSGYVPGAKKVLVWGNSLGGLISQTVAETNRQVDGALPMCGIYAGVFPEMRMATDVLYALREVAGIPFAITYAPGVAGYQQALGDLQMLLGALQATAAKSTLTTEEYYVGVLKQSPATFKGIAGVPMSRAILLAGLIGGLPEASASYDGITTGGPLTVPQVNSMAAMIENVGAAAVLGVLAKIELEGRIRVAGSLATGSANFIDNVATDYVARLSDVDLATYEFLLNIKADGTSDTTQLDRMLAKLASTKGVAASRLEANPTAVSLMKALPTPTGKVRVPTVALHSEIDPTVPAGHQLWLQNRVSLADRADLALWKKKAAWAKKAKKKPAAKPKPRPFIGLYADAPDDGWTVLGNPAATAAKRTSGVGHCNTSSDPTVAFGQMAALIDGLNAWVTTGESAGRTAISAAVATPALGFQTDRFWQPPALKTRTGS